MRIWQNKDGDMLTDEQLLRHIAAFGGLSAACERGDIKLMSKSGKNSAARSATHKGKLRLSDYLEVG